MKTLLLITALIFTTGCLVSPAPEAPPTAAEVEETVIEELTIEDSLQGNWISEEYGTCLYSIERECLMHFETFHFELEIAETTITQHTLLTAYATDPTEVYRSVDDIVLGEQFSYDFNSTGLLAYDETTNKPLAIIDIEVADSEYTITIRNDTLIFLKTYTHPDNERKDIKFTRVVTDD